MDPASSVAAELWRPPHLHHHHRHLASSAGRHPHLEASSSSVVTAAARSGGGGSSSSSRRRARREAAAPPAEEEPSKLASTSGTAASSSAAGGRDSADPEAKRLKQMTPSENNDRRTEAGSNSGNASKSADKKPAPKEPPKDYIHVRARRGQATDSHSLAERARREKISERMKVLQDIVPGCNKVIGKASVLDEIINYIQSLQRQVEFLSMKLETINAHMNNATVAFPTKDVFRPLLNITAEFTAEELEAALITPNEILDDVHMPLLKSIPPVTRMAMGRGTWVTVLCRKLKDWWHWVAEGDLPIIASHGTEIETYKTLEPAIRLVILKAICDIRVEQEDIRIFIDSSLKHGHDISTFRKERIGGDSLGISYWYEDDEILGHRLYREIRRVEQVKKEPGKRSRGKGGSSAISVVSYQWETVASTFDEFDDVAEKLFSSRNRTEVSLGKKLKIEYLPEIEKIHKKKERLLKKQQREALLLDSYLTSDGLTTGRSLRDRKPVTYTFDDYDRSINEAIKITKKREENSAEPVAPTANRRALPPRSEAPSNGKLNGPSPTTNDSNDGNSSKSDDYQDSDGEQENEALDRSNRRRKRSQRYTQDFVEAVSDIDPNFDSDDDIMGEAVYDEEYLRSRKQNKASSASEEDEEFRLEEDAEDDDEEEYSLSSSEDLEEPQPQRHKKLETRGRRGTKLRSVDEIETGLRRSKRSSRPRINYRQYDFSDSDAEPGKAWKSDASDPDAGSDAENDMELSTSSQEQEEEEDDSRDEENGNNVNDKMEEDHAVAENKVESEEEQKEQPQQQPVEKMDAPSRESKSVGRTFLDLNELAPGGGFDDGPSLTVKDDMDNI